VPVAYLLLVGMPAFAFAYGAFAWLCLLLPFLGTQRRFWPLLGGIFGPWFALRSAVTCWNDLSVGGLGVVLGAFGHLGEELRGEVEEVEPAP